MSASVEAGLIPDAREARPWQVWRGGTLAGLGWLAAAAVVLGWPDSDEYGRTQLLGGAMAVLGLVFLAAGLAGAPGPLARLRPSGPWLIALAAGLVAWELVTAKLDILPRPFFVAPQALLEVFTDDYAKLGESVLH
ncbi:hypothetical protein [Roseomonas sp. KE2513]|uniref:hypothetical protein n=1 Tax=Roseomonas sp. KE2513 TaxID=2479202 RepID=UPI0018DF5DB0|nr:hypothetical protein [Roseomonas sp. KE2513]